MNRKIIKQILDSRTIVIYFAACLLLFVVTPGQKSAMDILGGFSAQASMGLNIPGIMRWNLCVLPPVAVSILFMDVELGPLRIYTMLRTKSARKWFIPRLAGIAVANLLYLLLFIAAAELFGRSGTHRYFMIFLLAFFLHTFSMSVISVAICTQDRGTHGAILFFLLVEGAMVVIGDIFSQIASYLPPYWGMIQQISSTNLRAVYLFWIFGLSVVAIFLSAIFIVRSVRVH